MLREQINALLASQDELVLEITDMEESIKEKKKKVALVKSAVKRLVDLEEQLNDTNVVSV